MDNKSIYFQNTQKCIVLRFTNVCCFKQHFLTTLTQIRSYLQYAIFELDIELGRHKRPEMKLGI